MLVAIWCFEISFYLFILRCLVVSYLTISFDYFLYLACPLGLVTAFSFHLLGASFLRTYLLALLTIEFLILRAETVSRQIRATFRRDAKYEPKFSRWVLLKQKKSTMKILQTVNDIVKQFNSTNHIFDKAISLTVANSLLGMLIYPVFIFLDFQVYFKVIIIILYVFVLATCFIISIFNDSFISKVG